MKKEYNKLVRDLIPQIIERPGKVCTTEILSDEAYLAKLLEKLNEEVAEYQESHAHEELADILEVVYALAQATGCSEQELNLLRANKARERGSFTEKILLKSVEESDRKEKLEKMARFTKTKQKKENKDHRFFIKAFRDRTGRDPKEYIEGKLKGGSPIGAVEYLFNIEAAHISRENNCQFYDFAYFYRTSVKPRFAKKETHSHLNKRPANAGTPWLPEEEELLVKMYHSDATKKEMCATFKRTEEGLAARLVRLGVIEKREYFRGRK